MVVGGCRCVWRGWFAPWKKSGGAVAGFIVVMSALVGPTAAPGATPVLVRVVDGSSNPPTGDGRITFQGIGFPYGGQTVYAAQNPLIQGRNLYAPDLVRTDTGWNNYFGGWRTTGQVDDLIYLSTINGLETSSAWSTPQAIITNGTYHHVNDPTVVVDDDVYHMLYTVARWDTHPQFGTYFRDWINYSTSIDGVNWTPNSGIASAEISLSDPLGLAPGTLTSIARPSMVKTDDGWKMWFDGNAQGQPGAGIHSYLAHSTGDLLTDFEIVHRYPDIGGFPGFFEPDVVWRPDGTYLAVVQRNFSRLYLATSADGINFSFEGPVLDVAHPFYPRDHVSNPGLVYDQINDVNYGVAFGMANSGLTDHDIGFAYSQYLVQVRSPASSSGEPVWHVFARSGGMDVQQVSVFDFFCQFDMVRIIDPLTGAIILQQAFADANPGDVWELRFPPELPGDYNRDGNVDAADYTLWRDTFGHSVPAFSAADGDGSGTIDLADYNVWRSRFGATADAVAVAALPEPATLYLLAMGVLSVSRALVGPAGRN